MKNVNEWPSAGSPVKNLTAVSFGKNYTKYTLEITRARFVRFNLDNALLVQWRRSHARRCSFKDARPSVRRRHNYSDFSSANLACSGMSSESYAVHILGQAATVERDATSQWMRAAMCFKKTAVETSCTVVTIFDGHRWVRRANA